MIEKLSEFENILIEFPKAKKSKENKNKKDLNKQTNKKKKQNFQGL